MNILAVCSTLDFKNFVRRATLEEIWIQHQSIDFLFYTGVKNLAKEKKVIDGPKFYSYHFWVPERFKNQSLLTKTEYLFRKRKWYDFFQNYDVIFLSDPNQYYLLEYVNKQKIIYLLRDPNILLSGKNFKKEKTILKRADLILAISSNLATYYLDKYYPKIDKEVKIWSNSVNLDLWYYDKLLKYRRTNEKPIVGLAGNLTFVNDIGLLCSIADSKPEYEFKIAGGISLEGEKHNLLKNLLQKDNVTHLGRIPLEKFPREVINWSIGIVAADKEEEYSKYLNNNKQYQYLALGKPFVTYNHDSNYEDFGEMVFIAENEADFVEKIDQAIDKAHKEESVLEGRNIAKRHSSKIRTDEFLDCARKLFR